MTIFEKNAELAMGLFDCGAVKFGEFKLKLHEMNPDAPLSPIYIDLRVLRSVCHLMREVVRAYGDLVADLEFDCYADVPTAATPLVAILSYNTHIPMVSPRMDSKTHGAPGKVDGIFEPGQTALLVDDLVTTASSKLEAISILRDCGLRVHDIAVLVDREQGGVQELERQEYACHAVFKLSELLDLYVTRQVIDGSMYDRVIAYLRKNAWGGL